MHKKVFILFTCLFCSGSLVAQEVNIDPQKLLSGRRNPDSNFVKYLIDISFEYARSTTKNDSSEVLLTEALRVSEKIGYTRGLLSSREALGQYYFQKGKLSPSLAVLMENEATAIQLADSTELFNNLRVVASIYMKIGDMDMLRTTLNRRQYILDHHGIKGLKDTSYPVLSQYNSLAQYYALPQINKPDSVKYYFGKLYEQGRDSGPANLWKQLGNAGLGRYYTGMKMYDSAIYHYKTASAAALAGLRMDNYFGFLASMADAYRQGEQVDSAFRYAYMVYNDASEYSYLSIMATSSGLLANLYKRQNRYDSAVKYMSIESLYKDSIAGQETLKNIQVLTSDQQFRELEKQREKEAAIKEYKATLRNYFFIGGLFLLLVIILFLYRVGKQRAKAKKQIELAYNDLKSMQAQLIQSEKMASLGELTAGIAHEIQNPLNFVNNFSEVSYELVDELNAELEQGSVDEAKAIGFDLRKNLEKISHHGKRAEAIVKGMLQHSQVSSGTKEPTDINALADEYLRLAYHGLRTKDKSFNVTLKIQYDDSVGPVLLIPQDIGRVFLNLFSNAFYAVTEKKRSAGPGYEPVVSVTTRSAGDKIEILVADNGNGIPKEVEDKIFQPFFTSKPAGEGTGLGLSLAYDIVKAHEGELLVQSGSGEGAVFTISLSIKKNQ